MESDEVWRYKEKLPIEIEKELKAKYKDQKIPVNCTQDWRAMKDWVKTDGSINIDCIKADCPNSEICVTNLSKLANFCVF